MLAIVIVYCEKVHELISKLISRGRRICDLRPSIFGHCSRMVEEIMHACVPQVI